MAQQTIDNGTTAGDGTGESLFDSFDKVNSNFTELYNVNNNTVFSSRSAAESGNVPSSVDIIHVIQSYVVLSYQRDATGTALTTGDGATWSPLGKVYADHWEDNATPGTTDMTTAINAALSYVASSTASGGTVYLLEDDYRHTSTITYPTTQGIGLKGSENEVQSSDEIPTRLLSDFASGAAIEITESGQFLEGIYQLSVSPRDSATLDLNSPGLLMECPDDGTSSLRDFRVVRCQFSDNPGSGVVQSGPSFRGLLDNVSTRDNLGHGLHISNGDATSRANPGRPGGLIAMAYRSFNDGGHTIIVGDRGGFGAYRMTFIDGEMASGGSSIDGSIVIDGQYTGVIHGENIVFINCAFSGTVGGSASRRLMAVSGRSNRFISTRYIACTGVAHIHDDTGAGGIESDGIIFDGGYASQDSSITEAVSLDAGVTGRVTITDFTGTQPTRFFPTSYENGEVRSGTTLSMPATNITGNVLTATSDSDTGVIITRDSACGLEIDRTGGFPMTTVSRANGGKGEYGTTTDNDTALIRNGTQRLVVNSNTVNISSLPTSTTGLSSGDLWNDGGTLKVV